MIIQNPYTGIMVYITNNIATTEIRKPTKQKLIKRFHMLKRRPDNETTSIATYVIEQH